MGSAPPIRSPSQGLNRSSHLWESPKSDPLPPHGSLPPGTPATDTRRNLPYRWSSSRAETSTMGPSIPCASFPRRVRACPTKWVPFAPGGCVYHVSGAHAPPSLATELAVGAQGWPTGARSSQGPGTLALGDGESCLGAGRCSRRACGGQQSPRTGDTRLGGRRVLPRRWSVLKEGRRGAAVPKAEAHQPRGTGSPSQAVVGAQGGPAGGSSPQGPSTPAWGDGESQPGGGRCSRRACGGQQPPRPKHTNVGRRGVLPKW